MNAIPYGNGLVLRLPAPKRTSVLCRIARTAPLVLSLVTAAGGAGMDLPSANTMDEVSTAILGTGQDVWKRLDFGFTGNTKAFLDGVKGIRATSQTVKIGADAEGGEVLFAAILFSPIGGEESWYRRVHCGIVRKKDGRYESLSEFNRSLVYECGRETGGQFEIKTLFLEKALDKEFVHFEYSYLDSISTPRGVHTVVMLLDASVNTSVRPVWQQEVEYRYGGAGQPRVDEKTEYAIGDSDQDGAPDIVTTTTRVMQNVYKWKEPRPQALPVFQKD